MKGIPSCHQHAVMMFVGGCSRRSTLIATQDQLRCRGIFSEGMGRRGRSCRLRSEILLSQSSSLCASLPVGVIQLSACRRCRMLGAAPTSSEQHPGLNACMSHGFAWSNCQLCDASPERELMPLGTSAPESICPSIEPSKEGDSHRGDRPVSIHLRGWITLPSRVRMGAGAQWRADRLPFLTDVWHCAQNTICLLQHTGEDLPAAWSSNFCERPRCALLTSAYISLPPVCRLCTSDKWWQSYPVTAKRVAYSARQHGSPLPPSDCKAGASAAALCMLQFPTWKGDDLQLYDEWSVLSQPHPQPFCLHQRSASAS